MMFRLRFIAFIFVLSMAPLGCKIINKGAVINKREHMLVRKLDAVVLTADDVRTMELDVVTNHLSDNLYTVLSPEDIAYFKRVGQSC